MSEEEVMKALRPNIQEQPPALAQSLSSSAPTKKSFSLRVDLAGSMSNAISALRGKGRRWGHDDIEEMRESSVAMLEMVREHVLAVRNGDEATVQEFRDFYGLNPGDMLWGGGAKQSPASGLDDATRNEV